MSTKENNILAEGWREHREAWLSLRKFEETDIKEDDLGEYVEIEMHQAYQEAGEIKEEEYLEKEYLPYEITQRKLLDILEYDPNPKND